jgi:hypothetical protein
MINCFSKEILIFLLYMPLPNFNFSVEFLWGFTMLKELKLPNQIEKKKKKTHSANQIPCNCF